MTEKEFRKKERLSAEEKLSKKKKKKKRNGAVALLLVLIALLLVAIISVLGAVVFRINSITVVGNSLYTSEQIINTLGIEQGDSLLLIGEKSLSQKLEKALPYITQVEIKRKLPDSLEIAVTETYEEICYFDSSVFYKANMEGKILSAEYVRPEGLPVVIIGDGANYTEGEILEIGEEAKKEILQKLLEFRKNSGIDISIISVNDIYHNYFLIEDRLLVELGSASYLEQKLQFVPKMNEMMTDDEHNAIDLSGWSPDNNEAVSHEKNIEGYISFK